MKGQAASILARLRDVAKKHKISYQQALLLFSQEEFLRRLSHSRYANNLILKGGLLLYYTSSNPARTTMDADFLLHRYNNQEGSVRELLQEIINIPGDNDFISFSIEKIHTSPHQHTYSGIHTQLKAHIKKTNVDLSIDLGVGDKIVPEPVKRILSPILPDQPHVSVLTYSFESVIAEKFDAMIVWQALSGRTKDFWDIYSLSKKEKFDGTILQKAIRETLSHRETPLDKSVLNNALSLAADPNMQNRWRNFLEITQSAPQSFEDVMKDISLFLRPVADSIIHNRPFPYEWLPGKMWQPKQQ